LRFKKSNPRSRFFGRRWLRNFSNDVQQQEFEAGKR
jgi:hypothetical protein